MGGQVGNAQCWLPKHASQTCVIGASDPGTNSAITTAGLVNGVVAPGSGMILEHCAADALVQLGQQICIQCSGGFGAFSYKNE